MRDLFSDLIPFVTVAETGSYSAAATRLGVTPAAVSRAVARLEAELGVALLHRTTRRVSLSAPGEVFLERCREAISQVRDARELVALAQSEPVGDLTLSLSVILGRVLIGQLGRFLARHPGLHLHLHFTDRYSHLIEDGIDVAIRIGELDDSSLVARRLGRTRWATVAAPAYLGRHGAPQAPEDLAQHNCLKFRSPRGAAVEWTFRGARGGTRTVVTHGNLDADQGEQLIEAALAGLGVCQVFSWLVDDHLRQGRLVEVLAAFAADGPPIHALCLPGQQSTPRVRVLLDFLAEVFAAPEHSPP